MVLIDIEVVNAQLDYNLLLGRSYMYAMRAVESSVFHLIMFPNDGNIVTVDQLTYHDSQGPTAPTNVIPTIDTSINITTTPSFLVVGPRLFVNIPMMTSFPSLPHPLASSDTVDFFML